jgi:hypothetical protein
MPTAALAVLLTRGRNMFTAWFWRLAEKCVAEKEGRDAEKVRTGREIAA